MISSAVGGGEGRGRRGMDGSTQGLKCDAFTLYLCPLNSDFGLICLSKRFLLFVTLLELARLHEQRDVADREHDF